MLTIAQNRVILSSFKPLKVDSWLHQEVLGCGGSRAACTVYLSRYNNAKFGCVVYKGLWVLNVVLFVVEQGILTATLAQAGRHATIIIRQPCDGLFAHRDAAAPLILRAPIVDKGDEGARKRVAPAVFVAHQALVAGST